MHVIQAKEQTKLIIYPDVRSMSVYCDPVSTDGLATNLFKQRAVELPGSRGRENTGARNKS